MAARRLPACPAGLLVLLLAATAAAILPHTVAQQIDERDRDALLAVKASFKDFSNLTSWNSSNTLCASWRFITCDVDGRVTEMNLLMAGTGGTISPTIGNLTKLTFLSLSTNTLTGPIPDSIGNLVNLVWLSLSINSLTGSIPDSFGNLTSLQYVSLGSNSLTGSIPNSIGNLVNLTRLFLESNSLTGSIPDSMGNLVNLYRLQLDHNKLEGRVSGFISKLTKLGYLKLNDNAFTGSITLASYSLREFWIQDNYFSWPFNITTKQGKPFCLINYSNNCIYNNDTSTKCFSLQPQRSQAECSSFCSSHYPEGACSGRGTCGYDTKTCNCDAEFVATSGMCIQSRGCAEGLGDTYDYVADKAAYLNDIGSSFVSSAEECNTLCTSICQCVGFSITQGNGYGNGSQFLCWLKYELANLTSSSSLHTYIRRIYTAPATPTSASSKLVVVLGSSIGAAIAFAAILLLLFCFCFRRKKSTDGYERGEVYEGTPDFYGRLRQKFVQQISLSDILNATDNFSNEKKIGTGGFGTVFKGTCADGTLWAVKRAHADKESILDFEREVELLSTMSHNNIVALLGFCSQNGEHILVYEFIQNGTLRAHVDATPESGYSPLTFKQRLNIAVGVARALQYLHNFAKEPVVHRDIKPDNILLTQKMEAKIADFGLIRRLTQETETDESFTDLGPQVTEIFETIALHGTQVTDSVATSTTQGSQVTDSVRISTIHGNQEAESPEIITGHASLATDFLGTLTAHAGTIGYLDPRVPRVAPVSTKYDVYSFGVVLWELITGKRAIFTDQDSLLSSKVVHVKGWALPLIKKGQIDAIVDERLDEDYSKEAMKIIVEVAQNCTKDDAKARPSMADVTRQLETVLANLDGDSLPNNEEEEEKAMEEVAAQIPYGFSISRSDNNSESFIPPLSQKPFLR